MSRKIQTRLCALVVVLCLMFGIAAFHETPVLAAPTGPGQTLQSTVLSKVFPKTTQIYGEFPDLQAYQKACRLIEWLDVLALEAADAAFKADGSAKKYFKKLGITPEVIESLTTSVAAVGFYLNDISLEDEPNGAVALKFNNADAVKAILATPRFKAAAKVGESGQRYAILPAESQDGEGSGNVYLDSSVSADGPVALVWYEKQNIFLVGTLASAESVASVIEGKAEALTASPAWNRTARDFSRANDLVGYVDTESFVPMVEENAKQAEQQNAWDKQHAKNALAFVKGIFSGCGPSTLAAAITPSGIQTNGKLRFKGSLVPPEKLLVGPFGPRVDVTIQDRLPLSTIAYMSSATTHAFANGDELMKAFIEWFKKAEAEFQIGSKNKPSAELERGLAQFSAMTGISINDLFGAFGQQAAVAWVVPGDFMETLDDVFTKSAFIAVGHMGTKESMEKISAAIQNALKMFMRAEIKAFEGGWETNALAAMELGTLRYKIVGDHVFFGLGEDKILSDALAAFEGKGEQLKTSVAHAKARRTVSSAAQGLAWFDIGRMAEPVLKVCKTHIANMKKSEGEADKEGDDVTGLSDFEQKYVMTIIDAIRVTGDNRITAMIGIDRAYENGELTFVGESSNGVMLPLVAAGAFYVRFMAGMEADIPEAPEGKW